MAPDYTQKELFEELEHIGAIKTDFTIPDDTPTSQPTRPKWYRSIYLDNIPYEIRYILLNLIFNKDIHS